MGPYYVQIDASDFTFLRADPARASWYERHAGDAPGWWRRLCPRWPDWYIHASVVDGCAQAAQIEDTVPHCGLPDRKQTSAVELANVRLMFQSNEPELICTKMRAFSLSFHMYICKQSYYVMEFPFKCVCRYPLAQQRLQISRKYVLVGRLS